MAESATGVIEKVTFNEQNGWYKVHVEGLSHTIDTKYQEKAVEAKNLVGQKAELFFDTKQNGEYTNYYLKKTVPAKAEQQSFAPDPASYAKPMRDEDVLRITRLSAVSSAATLLAGSGVGPSDLITLAEFIVAYAYNGPNGVEVVLSSTAGTDGDDIPF